MLFGQEDSPVQADRFRFGDFEFDAGSGEVRRRDAAKGGEVLRLPPQPARLLALLADRGGGLLGRDEIRGQLWPDVEVDFDTNLHFLIRQIRTVLGDSATEPRYVENLPRRGYRLVPPVERVGDEKPSPLPAGLAGLRRALAAALALAAIGALGWWLVGSRAGAPAPAAPLRIGIMPFAPPEGTTVFGRPAPIADWILEGLTTGAGERAQVVGPTSTAAYAASDASIRQLIADFELDYVVNGRFVDSEDGPRMLAELIRASDGAHVWVRPYEDLRDDHRIGAEITSGVLTELGLARGLAEPST